MIDNTPAAPMPRVAITPTRETSGARTFRLTIEDLTREQARLVLQELARVTGADHLTPEECPGPALFAAELRTYEAAKPALLASGHEGQWVIVRGEELLGPFPDYSEAAEVAYQSFGLASVLLKQVFRTESVHYL